MVRLVPILTNVVPAQTVALELVTTAMVHLNALVMQALASVMDLHVLMMTNVPTELQTVALELVAIPRATSIVLAMPVLSSKAQV